MKSNYLFVYGTLLKDLENEMSKFLKRHADFTGKAYLYGMLYQVSWYPGLVLSDDDSQRVYGHVFKLHDTEMVLRVLDDYEGVSDAYPQPHQYKRALTTVFIADGTKQDAWVYIYNHSTARLKQITSGNFLNMGDNL